MTLIPVASTRTSTPLTTQRLLTQLNSDQIELQRQYDRLASGRKILRLSDDPAAAGRAIALNRGIDRTDQIVRNAQSTANFYQAADSALSRVDNALIEARAAAVAGAQSVISEDERIALSATLQETIDSVFASANSVFRDHHLLGGFLGDENAFRYDRNEIVYKGNEAVARTPLGSGDMTSVNVTASDALGANSVILEGEPLNAALAPGTRLVDLRKGQGVTPGVIRLSGGNGYQELDLRSAATIGDVADLISATELEGRELLATIGSDGLRIEYADGLPGTLAIEDTIGSTSAKDLSISNPGGITAPPIQGDGLAPRVTEATAITELNFGAGLNLDSGIQIQQGDQTFTITFENAETVSDVLIRINRSGADVVAELNQEEGRIVMRSRRSGVDYSIGENGGDDATTLGIRSATADTLIRDLNHGQGVRLNTGAPDLTIIRPDGTELDFDLESAETVGDVIDMIRTHPDNQDSLQVLVALNAFGNGLQLTAPPGANPIIVRQQGASDAGNSLGLIPEGENEGRGQVVGAVATLTSADYAPLDAGGTLDTLLRLQNAIRDGDIPEIGRLQERLDDDLDRASRTRGKIGVWARNAEQLKSAAETNNIRLQEQLSNEVDADLATTISDLSQRQLALEASMRIIGQTAQLTVLNFL